MSFTYHLANIFRFLRGKRRPYTSAVILAAGSGVRMNADKRQTKQLMLLDGVPVIAHTLLAFEKCEYIDEIVIVARKDEQEKVRAIAEEYNISKLKSICQGGEERSASSLLGMKEISDRADYVAIHDAARCLVLPSLIADVVSAAYAYKAASAGCKVKDTVKRVSPDGFIIDTPNRNELWNAQTPQVFSAHMFRYAALKASEDKLSLTDDNMVMEYIGQRVKMVDTGYENAKLTTKEDLEYFELVLARRKATDSTEDKSEAKNKKIKRKKCR